MPVLAGGQHGKSLHNTTVCKFHHRGDLMMSANRCGGKMYILVSIIGQMSCK